MRAARKRFLEDGVDGASLRAVARAARTSIGMVYYYFPTKDELFLAVLEDVYEPVLADLLRALDPSLPVVERIRQLYARVGSISPDERVVMRLILREALVSSARLGQVVERFRRGHLPLVLTLIGDAMEGGVFDPGIPPALLLASMMALGGAGQLLRGFVEKQIPQPAPTSPAAASEEMLQILLHGVSPRATGGQP